jgi:capsular exopolysaccharide synthesis family protein
MAKYNENFLSIAGLWRICVLRWQWFVFSVIVCLLFAIRYLIVTPNMYTRSASIMVIEESMGNSASNKGGDIFKDLGLVKQNSNINNVVRHINSLDVMMEVARRLDVSLEPEDVLGKAEDIQSRLSISVEEEKSTIINLTYVDYSVEDAERVLILIVQVYNEKMLEANQMVTKNTSRFIDTRLRLLEQDLSIVDDSIATFKSRYGITNLEHVSDIYLQQQRESDSEILKLKNQKAMAGYIRELLNDKSGKPQLLIVNSGIDNQIIESQIQLYNDQLLQLQSHLEYTSEQNPIIVTQEKELSALRKNILANINNHIRTINIQLQIIADYHELNKSRITSNPEQAKYLTTIEREQKVKESLYMYLLQKKEENEISSSYRSANTQMIDIPHGSDSPSSPDAKKILFSAILFGIFLPVTVIFLRATLNESVRDHFDIESLENIPFLGDVPVSESTSHQINFQRRLRLIPPKDPIVVAHGKQDPVNEAFRMVRTKLEAITNEHPDTSKVFMVTSTNEASGKTFVAMNLALVLAIGERHVLFIDCDLRKATASRRWNAPEKGLADYLNGRSSYPTQLLYRIKGFPTLDIMGAGFIPPNPTELLRSALFERLINTMRPQYGYIILDCPTEGLLADAEIVKKNVDHSLFVVRAGQYLRQRLVELEEPAVPGKKIFQYVVLNGVEINSKYYTHENADSEENKEAMENSVITKYFIKIVRYVYSTFFQLHR